MVQGNDGGANVSLNAGATWSAQDNQPTAEFYGVDALRYFLLRDVSFGNDGTFSDEAIVTRANADLSNSFGNLAQRVLAFIAKNCEGHVPEGRAEEADAVLLAEVDTACAGFRVAFDDLALSQGVETWMTGVFACNQYIDAQAPWALRKTDPERMAAVLGTLVDAPVEHLPRPAETDERDAPGIWSCRGVRSPTSGLGPFERAQHEWSVLPEAAGD